MLTIESPARVHSLLQLPRHMILEECPLSWKPPPAQLATGPIPGGGRETRAYEPEIPRPLKVLAMMAVGWCLAWLKALQSSSTLCPFTMTVCQLGTERGQ